MEEEIEIWRNISGCPGYQVSNKGRVKSLNYNRTGIEKILKSRKLSNGYLNVRLSKGGKIKDMLVHRLVASAFVQNNSIFNTEINHIDECKTNNCASNLEWSTREHNINFGTRNERAGIAISKALKGVYNNPKRSKKVKCLETGLIYPSTREVNRQLGFSQQNICNCCIGKRNTCGGFHWKYVE